MPEQERAMCRQRAGCNPGTAKADGQRAWWKLPRGIWRVLRVLRFEGWQTAGLNALTTKGYVPAATLEQQRLTARGLGGSYREGFGGVRVLSV